MNRRPILVYDGDCAFCTQCVRFAERWLRPDAELAAWQLTDLAAYGVPAQRAEYELLWIAADGRVDGGAEAVASLLLHSRGVWRPLGTALGAALRTAPLRRLAHLAYRLVADNRGRLPGGTPACALPADQRPGASRGPA